MTWETAAEEIMSPWSLFRSCCESCGEMFWLLILLAGSGFYLSVWLISSEVWELCCKFRNHSFRLWLKKKNNKIVAKSDLIAASSFTRLSSSSLCFFERWKCLVVVIAPENGGSGAEWARIWICCLLFWSAAVWLLQKENHRRPLLVQDSNHVSVSVLLCHRRTRNKTNSLFFGFIFSCCFSRGPHKVTKMRAASNDVLMHFMTNLWLYLL